MKFTYTTHIFKTQIAPRRFTPPSLDRAGEDNGKRGVSKMRFKKPLVQYSMQGGRLHRVGKWKCGHRYNPTSK